MITVAVIRDTARCLIGRLQTESVGHELRLRLVLYRNALEWRRVLTPLLEAHVTLGITGVMVQTSVEGKPKTLFLRKFVEMLAGNDLVVEYLPVGLKHAHRLELRLSLDKPRLPSDWIPVNDTLARYGNTSLMD